MEKEHESVENTEGRSDNILNDELSYEFILKFIETECQGDSIENIRYSEVYKKLRRFVNMRWLSMLERTYISTAIIRMCSAEEDARRESEIRSVYGNDFNKTYWKSRIKVTIFMAYSDNYKLGSLCETINREYATIKNYNFECRVIPRQQMLNDIAPKQSCMWYKVKYLNELLQNPTYDDPLQFLVWIDSDAVVINRETSIEDIVEKCEYKDLIIAEDMNPTCLLNTGVFIVRCCEWSRKLWLDVWDVKNYNTVSYYEQSALIKCLRMKNEGLSLFNPFHTYLPGAMPGYKLLRHAAIVPYNDLNSSAGWSNLSFETKEVIFESFKPSRDKNFYPKLHSHNMNCHRRCDDLSYLPKFIFHPAGLKRKIDGIHYVLNLLNISIPDEYWSSKEEE